MACFLSCAGVDELGWERIVKPLSAVRSSIDAAKSAEAKGKE